MKISTLGMIDGGSYGGDHILHYRSELFPTSLPSTLGRGCEGQQREVWDSRGCGDVDNSVLCVVRSYPSPGDKSKICPQGGISNSPLGRNEMGLSKSRGGLVVGCSFRKANDVAGRQEMSEV
jgi:hypothetical protein